MNDQKMEDSELIGLGYTKTEIAELKKLTGNESLHEISSKGLLAECSTYNTLDSHVYNASEDKTFFTVDYGWVWDKCPAWLLTDCAGVGWNNNFHPDSTGNDSYNKSYKTYVNQFDSNDKKYSSKSMVEKICKQPRINLI